MDHREFVEQYTSGKLSVYINGSYALRVISAGYLPKRYYWAHTFWSWVWLLSIPIGIILLFFNIGIGILVLFFISFLGGKAIKKSAVDFVLQHALEDEQFFNFVLKKKILIIKPNFGAKQKSKQSK